MFHRVAMTGVLLTLGILNAGEAATGFQPLRYIGYWHDGSGVFRDCTPPAAWNEYDFKMVVTGKDSKGKEQKEEVPGKERLVNIVWKVPHYNWCNGGMIVVGGKVIGVADRGGLGFYADKPADFVGALMVAFDPATGKELWRTDLDHWDLVPDGAALRKEVQVLNQKLTEVYRVWAPLGARLRARHNGTNLDADTYRTLATPVRALIPDVPAEIDALKGTLFDNTGYEQIHFFGKVLPKYFPELDAMRNRIQKAGYLVDPWAGKYDPLGISMQTPVSDGKRIYMHTAYGAAFCLDLDGKILWKTWSGGGWERAAAIPSPVLSTNGSLLHIISLKGKDKVRMAVSTKDGREVWSSPFHGSYQTGPTVLTLPIGGDSAKPLEVLYFSGSGQVLRAADGKEVCKDLPAAWNGRPTPVSGDVLIMNNKSADGGGGSNIKNEYPEGWSAIRLTATNADTVVPEALWQGKKWGWGNVTARDGVVFAMGGKNGGVESVDLKTGATLATAGGKITGPFHYPILAGDHLISLDMKGNFGVAQVSADGHQIKLIGDSRLGDRVFGERGSSLLDMKFSYGCQLFASGNRLFVRSMTDLYCLGDPNAPLRLSKEHQ
jgi:outer membrane protein assembly factor BamB